MGIINKQIMDYSNEDKEKALEVLTDLVEENSNLKRELLHIRRFLLAQLLNSENGEIEFKDTFRFDEDLDEVVKNIHFEIHSTSMLHSGTDFTYGYMYAYKRPTVSNRHKLTKEELLTEFEKRRYKECK